MAQSDDPSDRRNFLVQVGLAGLGSLAKPDTAAADATAAGSAASSA